MLYADAIRRQAEYAPRAALPAVTAALWRAFAEGHVTEAEAEALSALIEARQVSARSGDNLRTTQVSRSPVSGTSNSSPPDPANAISGDPTTPLDRQNSPRTGVGSRPVSGASLERRRRWAASGRLPPAIAARFTLAEQAGLALIAAETARKGDCRLAIEHMAAVAGVSRSTVKSAIREAKKLGLFTVEERKVAGWRNDTNIIRIISPEWTAWLRLTRKGVAHRYPLGRDGVAKHHLTAGDGVQDQHLTTRKGVTDREPLGRKEAPSRFPLGRKGVVKRHPHGRDGVTNRDPIFRGGGVKSPTGTPTRISKQGKTRTAEMP